MGSADMEMYRALLAGGMSEEQAGRVAEAMFTQQAATKADICQLDQKIDAVEIRLNEKIDRVEIRSSTHCLRWWLAPRQPGWSSRCCAEAAAGRSPDEIRQASWAAPVYSDLSEITRNL